MWGRYKQLLQPHVLDFELHLFGHFVADTGERNSFFIAIALNLALEPQKA